MSNRSERNKRELKIYDDEREYVSIEEAADFLQKNEITIRKMIKSGILTAKKVMVVIDGHLRLKTRIIRQSVKKLIEAGEQ